MGAKTKGKYFLVCVLLPFKETPLFSHSSLFDSLFATCNLQLATSNTFTSLRKQKNCIIKRHNKIQCCCSLLSMRIESELVMLNANQCSMKNGHLLLCSCLCLSHLRCKFESELSLGASERASQHPSFNHYGTFSLCVCQLNVLFFY